MLVVVSDFRRRPLVRLRTGKAMSEAGEPGMGKSRLTTELGTRLVPEPHTRLRYFCSPRHQDSALYRSSPNSSAPPDLCATTRSSRSLASCGNCSHRGYSRALVAAGPGLRSAA